MERDEETNPDEFMKQNEPSKSISDFFSTENRTSNLEKFLAGCKVIEDSEEAAYHWPTENDPHIADVVEWEKKNMEMLFPNICKGRS